MAKFYIATRLDRASMHNLVRDHLIAMGHVITYDWTIHGSQKNTSISRLQELGDDQRGAIEEADFVIVLLPGGGGTHTELGLSLGMKKPILIHSETPEYFELGEKIVAFYCCSGVNRVVCPFDEIAGHLEFFTRDFAMR